LSRILGGKDKCQKAPAVRLARPWNGPTNSSPGSSRRSTDFRGGKSSCSATEIETVALDVLEGLVEATYTRNRGRVLEAVNLKLDKLRFLFRLSTELQLLDQRRYEHASRGIDEIGRLVGGWIKAHRGQAAS
jgi:hypothetical protein